MVGVGNTRWGLYCAPYCSCRWSFKWWCITADCIWDELSPLFTLRHSLAVIHMQKSVCRSVKQISGTWPGPEIRSSEHDSTDKEIHPGSPPGATRSPRPGSQRQSWRNNDWSTVRLNVTLIYVWFCVHNIVNVMKSGNMNREWYSTHRDMVGKPQ
jgi:hypothetical protein